jgi:two-component system OmpR family sensor kinase
VAATLNRLLERLRAAFEAERSFAANAAHELRTPLAGAIAQAQRLRSETLDPAAKARAAEMGGTRRRLARLARAVGGRLRLDQSVELRSVARVVAEDLGRMGAPGRIALSLPETPVMSDLDPDAFGILCRNLVENALRHGVGTAPVEVTLTSDGRLVDSNDGPVLPADVLDRLTARFERAGALTDGSGLGLAIVAAIADRTGSQLVLESPRPGAASGFHASVRLPTDVPHQPRPPRPAQ